MEPVAFGIVSAICACVAIGLSARTIRRAHHAGLAPGGWAAAGLAVGIVVLVVLAIALVLAIESTTATVG
jgi:hypothetical protein